MEVLTLQLLFMGLIFVSTTFFGFSPILLGRFCSRKLSLSSETRARLLSDASCFGAGVFLFVCFLGLLPEADEKFHKILEDLGHSNSSWEEFAEFPWGFFVVTCGFLVIFSIDKFVHALDNAKSHKSTSKDITRSLITPPSTPPSTPPTEVDGSSQSSSDDQKKEEQQKPILNYECHIEACGIFEEESHGVPSSLMFLVALGIHSIFEGIAVGLQTSKDKIMEYSVAVLLHEVVMAITFGLEVSKSTLNKKVKLLYVLVFTSSIPIGIAVGIGLQNTPSDHREILSAVIEAFATGIFLHVIFIEILANEFPHHQLDRHKCRLTEAPPASDKPITTSSSEICLLIEKLLSIIAGFSLLIMLNVLMDGHAH